MEINPLHPAAGVWDTFARGGFSVESLIIFTRRSTVLSLGASDNFDVIKVFFGSDHILDAMPEADRATAYGFYWYVSKTPEERAFEAQAVDAEIKATTQMSGCLGWPEVVSAGEVGNLKYLRMRPIKGTRFSFPKLEPEIRQAGLVLANVADALATLHGNGLVHRDLYQENVLVGPAGTTVIDLGAVKERKVATGPKVRGPEPHWAPEYLTDFAGAEAPADIYSLGVMLHRSLTGDIPRPWAAGELKSGVSDDLAQLVLECLSKDASARPSPENAARVLRSVFA